MTFISSFSLQSSSDPAAEAAGRELYESIAALKKTASPGWQEKAIKLIRKARFDDPKRELCRLRAAQAITPEEQTLMQEKVRGKEIPMMMLGRALEIQKMYRETCDVLVHAQASRWLVYPDLIKELMKLNCPEKELHQFKFLRDPFSLQNAKGIAQYSKANYVDDYEDRRNLVSADAYLFNSQGFESAFSFLVDNDNVESSNQFIRDACEKALTSFYPNISQQELSSLSDRIYQAAISEASTGNYFVFCLPKERSHQIQYRAHPFGSPCQCHPFATDRQILEKLQSSTTLPWTAQCWGGDSPQFRLYTPALTKENGVKVYLITPDHAARKAEKLKVRAIAQAIHKKYRMGPFP